MKLLTLATLLTVAALTGCNTIPSPAPTPDKDFVEHVDGQGNPYYVPTAEAIRNAPRPKYDKNGEDSMGCGPDSIYPSPKHPTCGKLHQIN